MKVCPRLGSNPNGKDIVIAYNVNGTLWLGSPAGKITKEMVDSCRWCAIQGIVSGRADAAEIAKNLQLDFGLTGASDALLKVKNELYPNKKLYIHVADTYADEVEAKNANWEFIYVCDFEGYLTQEQYQRRIVVDACMRTGIVPSPLAMLGLAIWLVKRI